MGASIIWDSPFGPLRGDFAHVINKATDDRTQVFTLTLQQLLLILRAGQKGRPLVFEAAAPLPRGLFVV